MATIKQLVGENEALRTELNSLRTIHEQIKNELAVAYALLEKSRNDLLSIADAASAVNKMAKPMSAVGLPISEPWQKERAAKMAQAKTEALARAGK